MNRAANALEIMKDKTSDMFGTLDERQREEARSTLVYAILQTDMAQHFKIVDRLKGLSSKKEQQPFSSDSLDDRRYLIGTLLHSVDISNPLLPDFELSRKWAERINEEFLNQYKSEVALGIPETKMWASLNTNGGFYKSQVGFIDFIVSPLWTALTDLFRDLVEEGEDGLTTHLADNKSAWKMLSEDEDRLLA